MEEDMSAEQLANKFIHELAEGDFTSAFALFTQESTLISPFGELSARDFLQLFYSEVKKATFEIKGVFINAQRNSCKVYVNVKEDKVLGEVVQFDCVAIFECESNTISRVILSYDSYPMRELL
jgi:deoxyadenosine/deoxycytidine kinase